MGYFDPSYQEFIHQGADIQAETSDVSVHVSNDGKVAWLTCKTSITMVAEDTLGFESWQTIFSRKLTVNGNLCLAMQAISTNTPTKWTYPLIPQRSAN
ncbi:hypothetical protein GWO43_09425 [candidate division KSB1 bacterium]|nr:hypothetical protein [candidate division KSB1 bacterium]NIR69369.1 hypothetical protein [candidate division KSB1 bacterium]NIS24187.1 hypothetical protein [candidate division KSB1 bacterium]NIT71102.1 hypothetical protein [candidate division KSB1 bacterium]NIU24806.1 hypothetical protein [candidate division KSB1 bacterium]